MDTLVLTWLSSASAIDYNQQNKKNDDQHINQ